MASLGDHHVRVIDRVRDRRDDRPPTLRCPNPAHRIQQYSSAYGPLVPTLSDPQLMKPLFGLLHPLHVLRAADKQEPGEDLGGRLKTGN